MMQARRRRAPAPLAASTHLIAILMSRNSYVSSSSHKPTPTSPALAISARRDARTYILLLDMAALLFYGVGTLLLPGAAVGLAGTYSAQPVSLCLSLI